MSETENVSQPVSKAESAENKRSTPRIFLIMMGVGVVAIGLVLSIGTKFIFH